MAGLLLLFVAWLLAKGKFDDWLKLATEDSTTIAGTVTTTPTELQDTAGISDGIIQSVLDDVWETDYTGYLEQ